MEEKMLEFLATTFVVQVLIILGYLYTHEKE